MIRVLLYFGLVGIIALGAAWLADRPGTIVLTWQGWQIQTNLLVGLVALALMVFAVMLLWSLISAVLRAPDAFGMFLRGRRRSRGITAVSRGLVAVGVGDSKRAVREAAEARRYLGSDPLALLLQAQASQLSGDTDRARSAFQSLLEAPETRALGLRGLFVEAERRGDHAEARRIAEEAARTLPEAGWALDALFAFHCADHDWRAARDVVERLRASRAIDRATAERRRAVLLTAEAGDIAETDAGEARVFALEANKLAPDFVPAAALAARLLIEAGEERRGAKIAEATFRRAPHPELAELYVRARAADGAQERLRRADALATRTAYAAEARFAVARAAIDARDFARARSVLQPLLDDAPTAHACLLMAEIEEAERNDVGRAREWLSHALHAPADPAWVADGVVSEKWLPISPVSGAFDAFRWQVPPQPLAPGLPPGALAATERLIAAAAAPEPAAAAEEPTIVVEAPPLPAEPESASAGEAAPEGEATVEVLLPELPRTKPAAPEPAPAAEAEAPARHPVLPLPRPPDDPGPGDSEFDAEKSRVVSMR